MKYNKLIATFICFNIVFSCFVPVSVSAENFVGQTLTILVCKVDAQMDFIIILLFLLKTNQVHNLILE